MSAGYETLIVTFSDPIKVVYADKRAYGSHHFRIQHALRKGMAHTLHGYRRHKGILSAWRWKHRPHSIRNN